MANEDSKAIKTNMKAKKLLGQNFLTSQSVIDKIIKIANLDLKDIILEIGPGKGILTQTLLGTEIVGKVIAVEKDITLIPFLQEKFSEEIRMGKLILIYGDILDFDFQKSQTILFFLPLRQMSPRQDKAFQCFLMLKLFCHCQFLH